MHTSVMHTLHRIGSCYLDIINCKISHYDHGVRCKRVINEFKFNSRTLVSGGNAAPYGTSSVGTKDGTSMAGLAGWSGGSGGGGVGRTMKEYEDLLGSLQKENFNLKLRIYFLEEQAGISQTDQDVVKKNIELNVSLCSDSFCRNYG